jgi:hypothetical protein
VIGQNPAAAVFAAPLPHNNPAYVNLLTRKFIMGIISFSHCFSRAPVLSVLLAPLQTLMGLFEPAAPASDNASVSAIKTGMPRKMALSAGSHACQTGKKDVLIGSCVKSPLKPSRSRLKIVRQFEPGASSLCAGRMTISGSMADVCAELDRMAQREAVTFRN